MSRLSQSTEPMVRNLEQLRRIGGLMPSLAFAVSSGVLCASCTTLTGSRAALEPPAQVGVECANAVVVGLHWTVPDRPSNQSVMVGFDITRDGIFLSRTTELYFTDGSVAAQHHYSYSVAAVDRWGNKAAAMPIEVVTPAASARGDAPYCASVMLSSVSFDWSLGYTEANGSDLWPTTWGADGHVYAFFGDGGGIGGDDQRGRTSFGIADFTSPPPFTADSAKNAYGGYEALHPSHIYGKASALIAVGKDFYAVGGIYNDNEVSKHPNHLSNAPDRVQLAYSVSDAHSWQAAAWTFCRPHEREPDPSAGTFCPASFINFGPGNRGSRDEYVYLVGVPNDDSFWKDMLGAVPAYTYLARVPRSRLRKQHAYRFYAGIDRKGKPRWDADAAHMQPIFVDGNPNLPGCGSLCGMNSTLVEITYDFGLARYLGVAQGGCVGQTSLYEAPEPWGPWRVVQYNNIDPLDGTGGWANLGKKSGGAMGLHVVNAWTSPDGLSLWFSYSSNGAAPEGSAFPPPGTSMDSLNMVPAHLSRY